ncbi:MAG: tail fiber domain-containing protein [Flavobacteriales bacterium]
MFSDSSLKTNVNTITNASDLLNQMNPVSFNYDTTQSRLRFSTQLQYGFIAQQVEQVNSNLVYDFTLPAEIDSIGNPLHPEQSYKVLNYNGYIALLTRGFQEQQRTIDSLAQLTTRQDSLNKSFQEHINSLYNLITECCKNRSMENSSEKPEWKNATNIELSDAPSIVLDQNVPNPFAEQTTISFMLPETVKKAQLLFYNAEGKLIRALDLTQRGKGQINVFANDLSSGIYTYTLIADGEIVATKKMVKQ